MRKALGYCFLLSLTAMVWGATIYVAPNGNDAWSGGMEQSNADKTDGPLASLEGARKAVEALHYKGEKDRIIVQFAGGVYPMREAVTFTALDSGGARASVIYRAKTGERAVFNGGREVTGVTVQPNGHWRVLIPEVAEGKAYYEQLYVNGRYGVRARTPNIEKTPTYFYVRRPVKNIVNPLTGQRENLAYRAFYAELQDIAPLSGKSQEYLKDVVLVAYHSWETSRERLGAVDGASGLVVATGGMCWPFMKWGARQRYHLENYPEALDAPGEWYLSRDGWLEYIPRPGETPENTTLVFPVIKTFMTIKGEPDLGLYAGNLWFEGLSFCNAAYELPENGHSCGQAEMDIPAVIQLVGANNVEFKDCEIGPVGGYGIHFGKGCFGNALRHCWIHDLGAGGVKIGTGWGENMPASDKEAVRHQVVDNCIIQTGGRLHHGAIGVWIGQSCDNQITHNDIGDFYYTGVSSGWTWGYGASFNLRNKIEFNHIHDIGQGVLSDMGGVYTLGYAKGTSVSHNHIHHVYSYDYYGAGGQGLYTDEGTTEILMENNLVHHVRSGSFHQHYGRDNIIRNNILAFSLNGQIQRSRIENHCSFHFTNNIVYWDNSSPLFSRKTTDEHVDIHHNLYWNTTGKVDFNGLTFEQWRELGHGVGDVIADPLFVDVEHGDYHLKPESPAVKIGFKPFDYTQAGVYGDAEWLAKASKNQIEEFELTQPPPERGAEIEDGGFENYAVGDKPDTTCYDDGKGLIAVTEENAKYGKQCLKIQDRPGLSAKFNPHFHFNPRMGKGTAVVDFDVCLDKDMYLYVELREYPGGNKFLTGPSMHFEQGRLWIRENGEHRRDIMEIPPMTWFHVAVRLTLGEQADDTCEMTFSVPGREPVAVKARNSDKGMRNLHWFGFVGDGENDGRCWLDNISLKKE